MSIRFHYRMASCFRIQALIHLFCLTLPAAPPCLPELKKIGYKQRSISITAEVALTQRQIIEVKQVIWDTEALLAPYLSLPDEVALSIREFEKAPQVSATNFIETGYRFRSEIEGAKGRTQRLSKHPKYTRAVTAHEYGHLVFDKNLEKLHPSLDAHLLEAAGTVVERLLSREGSDKENLDSKLEYIVETLPARSELFADLVAVVYARDPDAVRKGIFFSGASEKERDRAELRSFANSRSPSGWSETNKYDLLAPVRGYLGKKLLQPKYRDAPGLLVDKVLRAIHQDLEAHLKNPELFLDSPEQVNRRLIQLIEK